MRRIGMPGRSRTALESLGDDARASACPVNVCRGVWATGAIPRPSGIEGEDGGLLLDDKSPDGVEDDQAMWIRTFHGVVVLLGCCHAGVVNTLDYIHSLTDAPLRAVIGGMHLSHADRSRWEAVERALRRHGVVRIVPCHCTGEAATAYLVEKFGNACRPGQAGDSHSF